MNLQQQNARRGMACSGANSTCSGADSFPSFLQNPGRGGRGWLKAPDSKSGAPLKGVCRGFKSLPLRQFMPWRIASENPPERKGEKVR